ncbi:DUF6387 family protein [Enterobacter kobei]|uniref:DUF6387 family protein n=1 Tax=Enterobacter kobei TaxID=208224 RepID=UPI002075C0A2|nr:DUF6387 family protein [Enterobacter kobei]MCM7045706.1 DUF6387 family protein [Enterobacter kobei]
MIKKINSKKELPKSFDLKKYEALESFSDKDLFRQLYWRSESLDVVSDDFPDYGMQVGPEHPIHNNLGDPFGEIKQEEWFLEKQREYNNKVKPKLLDMSHAEGIKPLMRLEVSMLCRTTAKDGYLKGKPIIVDDEMIESLLEEDNGKFWAAMCEPINLLNDAAKDLMITVDLNNRNDVLIDSFSKLIPLWRKEINFPEPEKPISGGWDSIRRKILDYKIIPLIDLLSWEKATNSKISLGVLSVALFPDGEKDAFVIAQTVKPFLDRIMLIDSLDKIQKELSKETK